MLLGVFGGPPGEIENGDLTRRGCKADESKLEPKYTIKVPS